MADPLDVALGPTVNPATEPTEPAPRDSAVTLIIGQVIADRYLVRGFVGEGGMGAVYRALDEKLGEEVALKVVRGTALDASLRDEVRLAQKVTHPNVCRTYDLEEAGGRHFIKMEYVAGDTLAARQKRDGKLAIAEAVRIARAIADGLAAAHAQQIVHRDLKPGNVMLSGMRVVLMDFGIARLLAGPGDVAGTAGYMAPEALDGGQPDERADLYALGCVLYEMLAGAPAGTARRDIREVRAEVPRWLARATMGLLARDRTARSAALAQLRRGPRSRWVIAAPAVAVIAIASTLTWRATRAEPWVAHIVDLPQLEENGDIPSFSPDGTRILFSSDRYKPNDFHVYTMNVDGTDVQPALADEPNTWWARFTPDGDGLVFSRGVAGTMARRDLATGKTEELGRGAFAEPCGSDVAFIDKEHGSALALRLHGGERRVLFEAPIDRMVGPPRCDAAGQHIAFSLGALEVSAAQRDVYVIDRERNVTQLTYDAAATFDVAIAPDGRSIVYAANRDHHRHLYEVELATVHTRQLTFGDDWDAAPDVSRDGSRLIFDRDTTSENLWTASDGNTPQRVTFQRGTVHRPSETARDGVIVAARVEGAHRSVVVIERDGSERMLAQGGLPFGSRDGNVYFYDPPSLSVVPLAGGAPRVIAGLPTIVDDIYEHADGLGVVIGSNDRFQTLTIDRASGAVLASEPGWIIHAPSGGWRIQVEPSKPARLHVLAPGAMNGRTIEGESWRPIWIDDHRFAYCGVTSCRIENVDGTLDHELAARAGWLGPDAIVSRDGARWYATSPIGNVTRHIIDNFGQRPWR